VSEAVEFISKAIEMNGKVFVFCYDGISLSAAVVSLFMMKYYDLSLEEAYSIIKEKRPIVSISNCLLEQIHFLRSKFFDLIQKSSVEQFKFWKSNIDNEQNLKFKEESENETKKQLKAAIIEIEEGKKVIKDLVDVSTQYLRATEESQKDRYYKQLEIENDDLRQKFRELKKKTC